MGLIKWTCVFFFLQVIPSFGASEVTVNLGTLNFASAFGTMEVGGGFNYSFQEWLSVGASVVYSSQSFKDTSINHFTIIAGPTTNIGPLNEAYFLTAGLAFRTGSADPDLADEDAIDPTGMGFAVLFGKRFHIFDFLSYRPSIGLLSVGDTGFTVRPLELSIIF